MTRGLEADLQRLWFSTCEHHWNSLAIIPSDGGIDVRGFAESLVETGRACDERPVNLVSGVGIQVAGVHQVVDSIDFMTGRGDRVIVTVDPIADNPGALPIVRAVSAALLVVRLGESLLGSAHATIEAVGRQRFLGSVVLREGSCGLERPPT
jgi:hypothetical protein